MPTGTSPSRKGKAENRKISRTAELILDRYRQDIKGGERFLSEELKMSMLAAAMYYIMSVQESERPDAPVSRYTTAYREAANYLFPDTFLAE